MAEKKPTYDIEKIVADMDPKKINKEVEMKHREARNKYDLKNVKADGYDSMMKEAVKYVQHHHKETMKADMPEHMASGKVRMILDQVYKKQGGVAGALSEAKKGNMAKVLDSVADALENEERSNYVQHVFNQIDPQDFDGHVQIAKQYKGKFEGLMPDDMKKKSAEELAKDYEGLIHHHISVVDSVKSNIKRYEPEVKKAA